MTYYVIIIPTGYGTLYNCFSSKLTTLKARQYCSIMWCCWVYYNLSLYIIQDSLCINAPVSMGGGGGGVGNSDIVPIWLSESPSSTLISWSETFPDPNGKRYFYTIIDVKISQNPNLYVNVCPPPHTSMLSEPPHKYVVRTLSESSRVSPWVPTDLFINILICQHAIIFSVAYIVCAELI